MMNGNLDFTYTVNTSPHSEDGDTPCVESFPNDIITVRPDGIVVMNTKECIASEAFTWECPHDAIRFDVNTDITGKCNLCIHLVDQGLVSACADNICLAHFIYFGEADAVRQQFAEVQN